MTNKRPWDRRSPWFAKTFGPLGREPQTNPPTARGEGQPGGSRPRGSTGPQAEPPSAVLPGGPLTDPDATNSAARLAAVASGLTTAIDELESPSMPTAMRPALHAIAEYLRVLRATAEGSFYLPFPDGDTHSVHVDHLRTARRHIRRLK